jgi:collagenase-like PrtC family protease
MKIIAPVNNHQEVQKIIQAGADEIFCGVLPPNWMKKYTNVASVNRREWATANLKNFNELKKVVDIAHDNNTPVFLALNALYTESQYPLVFEQIEQAKKTGIDALIVADLGLISGLKIKKTDLSIHISTGGTTFNSQTAKFYEGLSASRIVLPRHLQIEEIGQIVKDCPALKFEVFILNSGCKNIDGFCTFQHGINEILHRQIWNWPKKLNLDRHLLNLVRQLPSKLAQGIKSGIFGIDSACLLDYKVSFNTLPVNLNRAQRQAVLNNISSAFNLLSGVDTCGACRLLELKQAGAYAVKIVGRNYSTSKKVNDVKFLKTILSRLESNGCDKKEFYAFVKRTFKKAYKTGCGNLCYYPDGM